MKQTTDDLTTIRQWLSDAPGAPPRETWMRALDALYSRTPIPDEAKLRRALPEFQRRVLLAALKIPHGQVTTYGEIARRIGHPKAARAVGQALGHNPIPLVIPCHRVLGADGSLHGYGAGKGVPTKAWLLTLEGARFE